MNRKKILTVAGITLVIVGFFAIGLMIQDREEAPEFLIDEDNSFVIETDQEIENGILGQDEDGDKKSAVLYFFWRETCPYCHTQKDFLDSIVPEFPALEIKSYEVSRSSENLELFLEMAELYGVKPQGVPMTFIGDRHFVGFAMSPIGLQIIEAIEDCLEIGCPDPLTE